MSMIVKSVLRMRGGLGQWLERFDQHQEHWWWWEEVVVGRARWEFRCKDGSVGLVGLFHMGGTAMLLRYEGAVGKEDEAVVMWNMML